MALTATIYNFSTQLSDIDRGVYESFDLRLARHPSETTEYMLTRFLAYCLEYTEGIELTEGLSAGDQPPLQVRDLTGRVTAWIDVGMPDADRLHRASKMAGRVAVYTHRNIRQVLSELGARKIHGGADIPIYAFEPQFIESAAATLDRRNDVSLSVTERHLYLDVGSHHFETTLTEHRLAE